ncbi:INO80 complex subunit C-like [Uranotaenia lowii]|uniref:INO80 complex subunit C-like n=1 Tax=Uranotaenia lowii TaxID=190385 RepID=UPI0024794260|nr:INO80 complex subunit C-like [Uranotaenia lowii]XP_055599693.1 INO80 complex subunit C-like [Uranotaenia lowii]
MEENSMPIFKRITFAQTNPIAGNKKRVWKSLKQIVAVERTLPWKDTDVTYSSINAPPSFVPAKKYSDISGLIAPYTDPHSKLQYHNSEEFQTVRSLPMDLTAGYLALRGASSIV